MRVVVWRSAPEAIAALAAAGLLWLWLAVAPLRASAAAPPPGPAGADPAQAARDVLRDQEYWWKRIEARPVSTSWLESILAAAWDLVDRILKGIADLIARILRSLFGAFTGASSGGTGVVYLIVVALLAWSIWKLYPAIARWLGGDEPARSMQEGVTWQMLAQAPALFEQASQACRDGRYAEAIRLALLALIAQLEKQGLLRYDTTRTNREYQRDLRHRSELAECFGQLARIYERVWYGRLSASHAEAERAISLCGSVINGEDLAPE
jgi:hypothetical protein